ncbi:winged-helix domain-containing protein [Filibacter tadaridae]|uniref:Ribonuclease R winged-helix domain-containing protein n=1 Tax=Filibacter tadaridae TaxID=2483811 RepID=A0A3P5XBK3_9BACL|nr:winged-helix domain-containing protein [Filibacter tadaridae]VDC27585.1 hypothetical protein FILTAD_01675 [Filibacter tadaridae]
MKKKVHIISIQKEYLNIVAYQLLDIFGAKIDLSALTLQELTKEIIAEEDIVVFSKGILLGIARSFIPKECKIIFANREVNIAATKRISELPKGQQILIINDTVEHAKDTAVALNTIYFEHEYKVYNPIDIMPTNVDWIVTPGEMELVPRGISNVIDIGPRTLDFKTVVEIDKCLGEEVQYKSLMNRFFKSQLSLTFRHDTLNGTKHEKLKSHETDEWSQEKMILTNEMMNSVIEKIESHGFLQESLAILSIYKEARENYQTFGRAKVKMKLRESGIDLSDQQLRLRLEVMQELKLVIARVGRGGTKLSDKGEAFLKQYK